MSGSGPSRHGSVTAEGARGDIVAHGSHLLTVTGRVDTMGMAASLDFHSARMVRALIAAEPRAWPRYETVHGELLVTPAPTMWHQELVGHVYAALRRYLEHESVGHVFVAPADVSWGLPDVLVQPDVFVIPAEDADGWDWTRIRRLLLAVEVMSPGSVRDDRFTKRRLYQERETPLYWIIDSAARSAEVWTPTDRTPLTERESLVWRPAGASEPFVLPLAALFAGH